jgi:predicted CoA-binding protein
LNSKQIKEILTNCKTIAVVGLSREPEKASHKVALYMKKHGYRIVPVNPFVEEVLDEKSYPSLLDIPTEIQKEIDIVDIFRRSEDVQPVVEQAVKLRGMYGKPYVVWMQEGIVNEEAAATAQKTGFIVIMDKCIMQEHKRLFGKHSNAKAAQ